MAMHGGLELRIKGMRGYESEYRDVGKIHDDEKE